MITYKRLLSSFNNNRAKSGIFSILRNEDSLNIWSDQNWSEFGKQFNKSFEFPLPGRTGLIEVESESESEKLPNKNLTKIISDKYISTIFEENIDYLLNRPTSQQSQVNRLQEALGAFYIQDKEMKNTTTLSIEEDSYMRKHLELKAYECPMSLIQDFQNYFRIKSISDLPLTLITLSFNTKNDMATWNDEVESERELIIGKFVDTALELCSLFEKEGFWADYIDPSTGQPYKSPFTHGTFYETDERYRKLGFEIEDNGCCKIIKHHEWGSRAYVGCILTTANLQSKLVKDLEHKFEIAKVSK